MLRITTICLLLLSLALPGRASEKMFREFTLPYAGELLAVQAVDVNADGRRDLVLLTRDKDAATGRARRLAVFVQRPGGFAETPDQTLPVPAAMLLADFGDVAPAPGRELLFYSRDGVYFYARSDTGFVLQPQRLFEAPSMFLLPDHTTLRFWDFARDVNGDGRDEVLVPQFDRLLLFRHKAGGWQRTELPIWPETRTFGYFSQRFSVGHKADVLYSTPYLLFEDASRDGRRDLLAVYRDSLLVIPQTPDGDFAAPALQRIALNFGDIWRGGKIMRTHLDDKSERQFLMRLTDVNGDSVIDVVDVKTSTKQSLLNPHGEIHVHFGRRLRNGNGAGLYFKKMPDVVLQPSGTPMVLDVLDLNHDRKLDMVIPAVKINLKSLVQMLFTKSVTFEAQVYLLDAAERYPKKPNLGRKMTIRFSFRGGAASPVYEIADFTGDGLADIMSSVEERQLLLFRGDGKKVFEAAPGRKYTVPLPQDGDRVHAADLNGDSKSDLIIRYADDDLEHKRLPRAVRILLSR